MSDIKTQQRYVSIPLDIFGKVGNTIDAVVYGYIHGWENSQKTSTVVLHKGCQKMSDELCVGINTITRALQRLETLGLIAYKRSPRGILATTRIDVMASWKNAGKTVTADDAKCEIVNHQNGESPNRGFTKMVNGDSPKWGMVNHQNGESNVLTSCITSSITPVAAAVRDDDGGEPFESISTATLPAQTKPAIPAGLSALASQLGPIAENWLWSHVTSGTSPNDWRLATVLHETAGMNIRSPKLLQMKFNDLPETKPAPSANPAKPDRVTTKDGKRVLVNGQWVDAATPYPNQPAPGQSPPPRLDWSNGNHKPPGMPLGGLLGKRVVETTVAEQSANGATATAWEMALVEKRLQLESERAAERERSKRRQSRTVELTRDGKTLAEAADICRAEGLM